MPGPVRLDPCRAWLDQILVPWAGPQPQATGRLANYNCRSFLVNLRFDKNDLQFETELTKFVKIVYSLEPKGHSTRSSLYALELEGLMVRKKNS